MFRTLRFAVAAVLLAAGPAGAAKYAIKTVKTAVPKQVKPAVAKLMSDQAVELHDASGTLLAEVWFRKEVPLKPGAATTKAGYQQLEETTLLGVVRFAKQMTDYRKQKIRPGVYTLRLALQPMDGDHMGTAPYPSFCAVVPAARDADPAPMTDPKDLQDLSTKATGTSHPGVFLLLPGKKAKPTPQLAKYENDTWAISVRQDAVANGAKVPLNIELALVGFSPAA
jgi:hypothetical protein